MEQKTDRLGFRTWLVILVTGLAGQLCWHIENDWFNTFVYSRIAPDPSITGNMVTFSAITGILATLFFGTLSDRAGKRKPSMVIGYLTWAVTIVVFGLTEYLRDRSLALAAAMVVVADCVMTFFGSMAHDAGFNPWTSDITDGHKRGGLGAVIAVLPVFSTIVGSVLFGILVKQFGYTKFFVIIGVFMAFISLFTLLFLKDAPGRKPNRDPRGFWHQFFSFFNFEPLKNDRLLCWVLVIFATYFIGFQIYFTQIGNYLLFSCHYAVDVKGYIMAIGLVLATPVTAIASRFINKKKYFGIMCVTVVLSIIGLLILGLNSGATANPNPTMKDAVPMIVGIFFVGAGYMCIFQTLMVMLKNMYPEEVRAQSEGLRYIFYVLIPMCVGTPIGTAIIKRTGIPVVNDYGIEGYAAGNNLFLIAAAWTVLTFLPIWFASREAKKRENA